MNLISAFSLIWNYTKNRVGVLVMGIAAYSEVGRFKLIKAARHCGFSRLRQKGAVASAAGREGAWLARKEASEQQAVVS